MGLGPKFSTSYCFYLTIPGEAPSEHFLFEKKEERNLSYIIYVSFLICESCVPNLLKNFIIKRFIIIIRRYSSIEKFR